MPLKRTLSMAAMSLSLAIPQVAGAAPSAEQGEIWAIYPREHGQTSLSYGQPETDNIAITLMCRPGEGAVHAMLPAQSTPTPEPAAGAHFATRVRLRSGAVWGSYNAQGTMTDMGAEVTDLRIPLSDPMLRAFRSHLTMGDAQGQWPARTAAERRAITRFLNACAHR